MKVYKSVTGAVLAVAVLSACGYGPDSAVDDEMPVSNAPVVSGASAAREFVHWTQPERCASPYNTPVRILASPEVAFKVRSLVLCTTADGARTRFINESTSLVWTIDQPSELSWNSKLIRKDTPSSVPIEVGLFRSIHWAPIRGLPLEPGQTVTFEFPPSQLHMYTDTDYQASWEAVSTLVDEAKDQGVEAAIARLSRNSAERRVVLVCGYSAFQNGQEIGAAVKDPALELAEGLGLAAGVTEGTAGCVNEVRKAQLLRGFPSSYAHLSSRFSQDQIQCTDREGQHQSFAQAGGNQSRKDCL